MLLKIENGSVKYISELPKTWVHDQYITFNPTAEMLGYQEYPEIEQEEGYFKYYGVVDGSIQIIATEIEEEILDEGVATEDPQPEEEA